MVRRGFSRLNQKDYKSLTQMIKFIPIMEIIREFNLKSSFQENIRRNSFTEEMFNTLDKIPKSKRLMKIYNDNQPISSEEREIILYAYTKIGGERLSQALGRSNCYMYHIIIRKQINRGRYNLIMKKVKEISEIIH